EQAKVVTVVLQVPSTVADLARGHPADDLERGHVTRNDGSGRDDRAVANGDTRQDHRPCSNEDVVAESDRPLATQREWMLQIVIGRENDDVGGNGNVRADFDAGAIIQT